MMWRMSAILRIKIRLPCTGYYLYLWPVLIVSLSILKIILIVSTPPDWPYYRNFHYPELPVPFVSVSPLKNVPVAKNSWIVTSCWRLSDELIVQLLHGGWKIVITAGSHNYSRRFENCIILDNDARLQLTYKLKNFVSDTNCESMKNLGYLYAIEHGAEFIYEIDGGYIPMDSGHPQFLQSPHTGALVVQDFSQTIFDPLRHFGAAETKSRRYVTCKIRTPPVQHSLTITTTENNKDRIVDIHSPPVVLSKGMYAAYDSFNTFYTLEGFWSLLLIMPTSNYSSSKAELHRSFWTQRLLALIGHNFAIFPPNAMCDSSSLCKGLKAPTPEENDNNISKLLHLFKTWDCKKSTFFDCIKELGNIMVKERIWELRASEMIAAWIDDLAAVGYKQPQLTNTPSQSPCLSHAHAVHFKPSMKQISQENSIDVLQDFCKHEIPRNHRTARKVPSFVFDTILLVVIFNHAHYNILNIMDNILRDHFPNRIYCGPKIAAESYQTQVSYVNSTDTEGYFGYECLLRIMEMGYQVDGYLVVADDILLNYWNIKSFDLNSVWAPSIEANGWEMDRINGSTDFYLWHNTFMGKDQVNRAFDEIIDILEGRSPYSSISELVAVLEQLWANRWQNGFGNNIVVYYPADIYYLPAIYSNLYYHALQVFRRFDVFQEFPVPTTIESLSVQQKIVRITGKYDWSGLRNANSMTYFNSSMVFLHPVKLGMVMKSNSVKVNYCTKYISSLLEHW